MIILFLRKLSMHLIPYPILATLLIAVAALLPSSGLAQENTRKNVASDESADLPEIQIFRLRYASADSVS